MSDDQEPSNEEMVAAMNDDGDDGDDDNFDDDEDRINLALNSDFDSALLNCLEDDEDDNNHCGGDDAANGGGGDAASDFSHSPSTGPSAVPVVTMPRLPSFVFNDNSSGGAAGDSSLGMHRSSSLEDPGGLDEEPATAEAAVTTAGGPNYYEGSAAQTAAPPQMHPLAIPSSANCPPVNTATATTTTTTNNNTAAAVAQGITALGMPALADPTMTAALQAAFAASFMQMSNNAAYNPALVPLAYNALAAGVDLSNFLPQFQAPAFGMAPTAAAANGVQPPPQQNAAPPDPTKPPPMEKVNNKPATKTSSSKRRRSNQSSSNKRSKSGSGHQSSSSQRQQPPFLLFDAPVELRQNFIQSQRAHGIPVLEDNNSYHFGMTVNGFHPQRSLEEPFFYKSLHAKRGPLPDPVPVVDARHADVGSKRLKNAKEQKRAHRISELIDQLRVKMEKGGWKVGIKSKFHTLSS